MENSGQKLEHAKQLVNRVSIISFVVGVTMMLIYLALVVMMPNIEWDTATPTWPIILYSMTYNTMQYARILGPVIVLVDLYVYIKTFLVQRYAFQWMTILGVIGCILMFLPFLDPMMRMLW